MSDKRVVVSPSADELFALVADKFVSRAGKILSRTGQLRVVLTGGDTQSRLLRALSRHPGVGTVKWNQALWILGDERFVDQDSAERNLQMVWDSFLGPAGVGATRVLSSPSVGDARSVDEAAGRYRQSIQEVTSDWASEGPLFDIALVGMGADGHVLSVFPGSPAVAASEPDVVGVQESPKPPAERVTLTLPLLNRTERVWIVASGVEKAGAVGLTMAEAAINEVPVAGVRGTRSTKVFIDAELADMLPTELIAHQKVWTAADERADYVPEALR